MHMYMYMCMYMHMYRIEMGSGHHTDGSIKVHMGITG